MKENGPEFRDGKIVRSEEPLNLEMPFETLDGFITPTKSFYVRTHFPIPRIDRNAWRLRIDGEVEKPFEIGYDELIKLPSRKIPVTLECAGNNRSFLKEKVKGVQWGLGAVGNAEWTGVPLSSLLDSARMKSTACDVILEGADNGKLEDPKAPADGLKFARSIPIEKARDDVLLVYKMNDAELPPEHGFPVRAIVPGWYAMASIKWLDRIVVTDRPFNGYYQTLDYAFWNRREGSIELTPLSLMRTKAEISKPAQGESVPANSTFPVRGAAWTGNGQITKVEISEDGGMTWSEARLKGDSKPNAWRLWEFDWKTPGASKAILMARATDSKGGTQSTGRDPDRGTYMIDHLLAIEVQVK